MFKNKLWAILTIALTFSCSQEKRVERPMEMWVFRSVMDGQPRMLTAVLNDEMWVSYDVQKAQLYKAWKGGVNFDGAVYTTVHGPQPTSLGYAYFQRAEDQWVVVQGGEEITPEINYKGHRTLNNHLTISYELVLPTGESISIKESPEYIKRGDQNGLKRVFELENSDDQKVGLRTSFNSLMSKADFKTTGTFDQESVEESVYDNGKTFSLAGTLWLNPTSVTEVKTYYHPGFDKLAPTVVTNSGEEEEIASGAAMIERNDCESCHNETVKTVGPAYLQVAQRYNDSEETVSNLSSKVIKGGSGVWGVAAMTAHPDLMEEDAKEMVRYILSLDDNLPGGSYAKYTLGEKTIPIKLADSYEPSSGNGFVIHGYKIFDESADPFDVIENQKPVRNGVMSKLHALGDTDFDVFVENFVLVVTGNILIPEDGSYDFRLISDDGSFLYIDEKEIIDNGGLHGASPVDGEVWLEKGSHELKIIFHQAKGGAALSFQWFNRESGNFELVDNRVMTFDTADFLEVQPYAEPDLLVKSIPGDGRWLAGVHPSFDIFQARPNDFHPRMGGIDFLDDDRMVICTWDSLGPVYIIDNWQTGDTTQMTVKRIATGLAEPLGIKVVDGDIYVLQKQELTRLRDLDGDEIIDAYETVSDDWLVSANFHEFAFGLEYKDGYFYGALATAILPGGASAQPQIPDRGKIIKINKETGEVALIAHGLRTPNGIGTGVDGELFIADNQGDWLPASKIIHVQPGAFYGQRSVDPEGTADLPVTLPVVWLPQDEIGNSPSTPLALNLGPYKGQMIHGEVTHGGVKRVYVEKVDGMYQGAVFRFTQGIEAGVNRIAWAPDGSLMIGGIGVTGNWGQTGKLKYGLQRIVYNERSTFEMLSVSARSDGFEIEFTEPIKGGQYLSAEDFEIQQWYYKPTAAYGGPKMGLETLKPTRFSLSEDRRKVRLSLKGMKPNHMVYFHIVNPFISEDDQELWSTESWYTLNYIPQNLPIQHSEYQVAHNTLTEKEKSEGWKLLFDGKSTDGIRGFNKETIGDKWSAKEGTLYLSDQGKGFGGDVVVTDKPYQNYELYLEWKISKGGNSGVIFNTIESPDYDYPWLTGPEMQILDNERHPDGQIYMHRAGDLYDMIPCKFVTANGPEKWNRIRIVMKDGNLQQWQNGYKVVETTLWDDAWKEMVANSKFKNMPAFGTAKEGHIVLQDHGDPVSFRNIKIREL